MSLGHSQLFQMESFVPPRTASFSDDMSVPSAATSSLFPTKLHAMLEDASQEGFDDVVCWLPGGATFKVLDPARFTTEVMPNYFNQRKYKSFLRQLNLYGFQRIHHGPHKGGYTHKFFLQGTPALCEKIAKATPRSKEQQHLAAKSHRRVVSMDAYSHSAFGAAVMPGTSPTPSGSPVYVEDSASDSEETVSNRASSPAIMTFEASAFNPLPMESPINRAITEEAIERILPSTSELAPMNEIFDDEPIPFHEMDPQLEKALLSTFVTDGCTTDTDFKDINMPIGNERSLADDLLAIVNDKPTPFTSQPRMGLVPIAPSAPMVPLGHDGASPNAQFGHFGRVDMAQLAMGAVSEFNFPRKVFRMLDDAEQNPMYKQIVSWVEEGMSFKVHNKKLFVEKILPIYFDMTQYASFRRQLNMYSFERKHNSIYSNPFFVRGCPDLLDKITRKCGNSKNKKN